MKNILGNCYTGALCFVFGVLTIAGQEYKMRPNTTQERQEALADGSSVTRRSFIVADEADRTHPNLEITMIYDSRSKLIWWDYENGEETQKPARDLKQWIWATSNDRRSLVGFTLQGTTLNARVSTTTADSIPDAQSKILLNSAKVSRESLAGSDAMNNLVPLEKLVLSRDFSFPKNSASFIPTTRIKRVNSTTAGWEVEISGVGSQSAVITLNSAFGVVNTQLRN